MSKTRIIGCVAAKGGVGKTTSSINLSAALGLFGKSVTIVDGNVTTPNIGIYLGVPIAPITIHDVLRGKNDMVDAVYNHRDGVKIVPASIALKDAKKIEVGKLRASVSELYGECDFVIVDGAAGLGKESISIIKSVDEVLIVTNPEMPAVTDALKTIKIAKELKKKVLGVLITKTNSRNADMSIKDIENILEAPIIGIIPEDRAVKFSQAQKEAVIHAYPKSAASIQYKKLAADLIGEKYDERIDLEQAGLVYNILRFLGIKD